MSRVLAGDDATGDTDAMTDEAAARERIVVGLRRRDGLDRDAFHAASGLSVDDLAGSAIAHWVAAGLASDDGRRVRLTRAGLLVSDGLWHEILAPGPR
jgi:oxygen-independent coproporphyrinogen-3 oxidase